MSYKPLLLVAFRTFLEDHFNRSPISVDGDHLPNASEMLATMPILPKSVRLHGLSDRGGYRTTILDSSRFLTTAGIGVASADFIETRSSSWSHHCAKVSVALGIPVENVHASLFIAHTGCTVPWHFDAADVLACCLLGRRRWELAKPNAPTQGIDEWGGTNGFVPDADSYADVKAGDWLYVPRGYWHRTTTLHKSLSVSFAFSKD